MRLSGLQKEVLALYRQCLRECRKKPQGQKNTRAHFEKFVRDEFARNIAVEKRDFAAIEFLLRKGHRQLDVYSSPGIKDIRQRPKSRVIILSKRSSRAHTPIRKASPPMTSPGSVYSSDTGPVSEQPYTEMPPKETHKSPPDVGRRDQPYIRSAYDVGTAFRGVSMKSLDGASSLDQSWVPSEPSVDLDSFPLPPPKNPPQQSEYSVNPLSIAAKPSRSHASTLQNPGTSTCFARAGFSPPPVRRKAHMRMHRSPRSSHGLLLDGVADFASASKHTSIDSALVEAISRSVCQQLRLFSARSKNNQERSFSRPFREASHSQQSDQSDKFAGRHGQSRRTKHLWQQTNPPATPTKSNISLRTVSPLMPFRPEFKAAGLAVTSKDQKRGFPAYIARLMSTRSTQKRANRSGSKHHAKVPKFDGFEEEDSSGSSMSQISFAPSQDMDEWRDSPPTPPPKPTPLVIPRRSDRENRTRPRADSSPRSPRQKSFGARDAFNSQSRQPTKPTAHCHGGCYDGEPCSKEQIRMQPRAKRAQTTQNPPTRHLNSREDQTTRRPYQSLPTQRFNRGLSEGTRFKTDIKSSQPRPSFDPDHVGVCCRSGRGATSQANAPPNIPTRTSSIRESASASEDDLEGDDGDIVDRDVLRGLHIVASAACDEEVDAFVRNRTGLRLRRFLADLKVLETLRDIQPVEGLGPGARRRRSNMRQLKRQVRRFRDARESVMAA
ncbi:complex 1 protein (LYR family) domain-containing protein [Trichoderma breve]|uniref:Complex 1 protein (LYR family) domain-containing protein n=1 Tax=Trichoderma breve TaxID=2034170 RepID=A0A9W9ECL0_9HYPO|nr:complex 1 protein (LYR family) domain-containing protein [Trichoderma breve]KAJ4864183.1 complex 1 protein (LYR family) domain-containing protein [Trichoderma breve]